MKIKSNSNKIKIKKVREEGTERERERGQRQTGKFACLECLDMLKSSVEFLVVAPSFFTLYSPVLSMQMKFAFDSDVDIYQKLGSIASGTL